MSKVQTGSIAVLMGGWGPEREISLVSGEACWQALHEAGANVHRLDAQADLPARLSDLGPSTVFNALHGPMGEDGCVQGLLEVMSLAYTHSGVTASALAMDKPLAKAVCRAAGVPVAEHVVGEPEEWRRTRPFAGAYVVKPSNSGSSVDVFIVEEGADLPQVSGEGPWMAEHYVPGRELSVAVLRGRALSVTDIVTEGFYDYRAKYTQGGSRHITPANLPRDVEGAVRRAAETAYSALGCRGLARADFRYDETRGISGLAFLEVNTQPGMTPHSIAPEQAALHGLDFQALVVAILEDASCRR